MPEEVKLSNQFGNQELNFILETIDDIKAVDVTVLSVKHLTEIFDYMVISGATSRQHAKSISRHLYEEVKKHNIPINGIEGDDIGEWVLIDFGDIIVHIMTEETRSFYELEKLWGMPEEK